MHVPYFFFNDTATTEIYTLSLHDALPIYSNEATDAQAHIPADHCLGRGFACSGAGKPLQHAGLNQVDRAVRPARPQDRKSTRLNSSHANISYAVFCLKKKKYVSHDR